MKERLFKLVAICCFLFIGLTNATAQIDCECDFEFDPVCIVTVEGDTIPFPNACFAECEGYGEDAIVDCPEYDGEWPGDDCDCELEGETVCVLTAEDLICVFPNMCFAECAGYGEDDVVECEENGGEWPEDECDCDWGEFDPVCIVTTEGDTIPFPSACIAACEGFGEDAIVDCPEYDGEWPGDDCDCEFGGEEVCVLTAEDLICVFPNMCFAECAGYGADDVVECEETGGEWPEGDCDCDFEFDPICIVTPEGDTLSFPNACLAECLGFGEDTIVDCPEYDGEWPGDDCDCELDGEEVCVLTAEDLICVFPNMCFAECAGYGADDVVECEENGGEWPGDDCDCDFEGEEVCITIEDEFVITFPNACWAECAGFSIEDTDDCEGFTGDNGPIELAQYLTIDSESNQSGFSGEEVANLIDQAIKAQTTSIESASIYPNPISGNNLTIELDMLEESVANITIISITGQTVQQLKVNVVEGTQQIEVNVNELTNGVYLAKIETASNTHSIKFIKQ